MKRYLMTVLLSLFALAMLAGCETVEDDSDGSVDADADTESNIDTDTGNDANPPTSWNEEYVLPILNQKYYDWAIQQRNVLVMFTNSEDPAMDDLNYDAYTLMIDRLPWLWLAKVELSEAPEVFANAGVEITPTVKFFSYGVEMPELILTGDEVTRPQMAANFQILVDRYEPDILVPITAEELEMMIADATTPVVVKFGTPWCSWCNWMTPRLELASIEYGDELLDADNNFIRDEKLITIVDVNIEQIPMSPEDYGFIGIPFFFFYSNGELLFSKGSAMPYQELSSIIDSLLTTLPED